MAINLGVIYGSKTVEHDVAIVSALQFMDNADSKKYNIIPVYIARDGRWYTGDGLRDIAFYRSFDPSSLTQVWLEAGRGKSLWGETKGLFGSKRVEVAGLDVVAPIMHGLNGEDGTLQGLLELSGIPYTSSGVLGCALGMDKVAMKMAFKGAGFPVLDCVWFQREEYKAAPEEFLERSEALGYPVFVKPANLGSSIGITKAVDKASLVNAIEVALHYDRRILVEKGVSRCMEINCSALGWGNDVKPSLCEQPVNWEGFLDFDKKYLQGSGKGMKSMGRNIPAPLPEETTRRIQELTCQAFRLLDCKGVVRVDFILDEETNDLYINEINIIPGSLSFYLWEPTGLPYAKLIDVMVENALSAFTARESNNYAFDSEILQKVSLGSAKGGKGLGSKT